MIETMDVKITVPSNGAYSKPLPNPYATQDQYAIGDCYERRESSPEWTLQDNTRLPYLTHIKYLSKAWKPLQYLADFMEVGTTPLRWKDLKQKPKEREERMYRTEVTLVEYFSEEHVTRKPRTTHLTSTEELKEALSGLSRQQIPQSTHHILMVEDLSQQVIELLGAELDIDPLFFRQHIVDYNWYNTRDPWAVAPSLLSNITHRNWFHMRNIRLRYHQSVEEYELARQDSGAFNVLRRPDNDENHWLYLDKPGSVVSISRTRTSIWVGKHPGGGGGTIGIVLIDPTVIAGTPLWYGRTNWLLPPSLSNSNPTEELSTDRLYTDIIRATLTYPWFPSSLHPPPTNHHDIIAKPSLYTICAEWLVVCDYVKARLGQIEWELEKPGLFRSKGDVIESSLQRLHTWRRVVPMFREMVTETLEFALPAAARLTIPSDHHEPDLTSYYNDIAPDFQRVKSALNELQSRIDRLTSVVTSEISTEDSRRALQENHNLARLTWLATTFIPLSYVSGLFSMQNNIRDMKETFGWYFSAALPLTMIAMVLAGGLGRGWFKRKKTIAFISK